MIYGLLLAAGESARMGQPKALLGWRGAPLVCYLAQQALASQLAGLIVVVGAAGPSVRAALGGVATTATKPFQIVDNWDYAAGQAASLRAGIAALPANADGTLVLLVDQPLVTTALIDGILAALTLPDDLAVVPHYQGQRGNPVLLTRAVLDELGTLRGDQGARVVLQRHQARIRWLDVNDPAVVLDADTPQQWVNLQQRYEHS